MDFTLETIKEIWKHKISRKDKTRILKLVNTTNGLKSHQTIAKRLRGEVNFSQEEWTLFSNEVSQLYNTINNDTVKV